MKFCEKCGHELNDEKFCPSCGNAVPADEAAAENVAATENTAAAAPAEEAVPAPVAQTPSEEIPAGKKKINLSKKMMAIIAAVVVVLGVIGIIIGNAVSTNKYKKTLEQAYNDITNCAEYAESYASLQSKVWYNCIYEKSSYETDEYTKDDSGRYYDDFNDALRSFYSGEAAKYNLVKLYSASSDAFMSELKDGPAKYEDEYAALKELYVAASKLSDLVVGTSSYSYNTFNEALDSAKSEYKSALSAAKLIFE